MKPAGASNIERLRLQQHQKPAHVWLHLDETFPAGLGQDLDIVIAPGQSLASVDLRCLVGLQVTVCVHRQASESRLDRVISMLAEVGAHRVDAFREWLPAECEDGTEQLQTEIIEGKRI